MLIIIDKRFPEEVKTSLSAYGEVVQFCSYGITYDAISGHPDIFFCQSPEGLILAPNTPPEFIRKLEADHIPFIPGSGPVGEKYPFTARYNAVVTRDCIIHKKSITDQAITGCYRHLRHINVRQAYTRCNLLSLGNHRFISSDAGITKALKETGEDVLEVSNEGILLPGFDHGFFGGCCGIRENILFVAGSLETIREETLIRDFIDACGMKVVELYDGPLVDGGGILFIESERLSIIL